MPGRLPSSCSLTAWKSEYNDLSGASIGALQAPRGYRIRDRRGTTRPACRGAGNDRQGAVCTSCCTAKLHEISTLYAGAV